MMINRIRCSSLEKAYIIQYLFDFMWQEVESVEEEAMEEQEASANVEEDKEMDTGENVDEEDESEEKEEEPLASTEEKSAEE